MPKYSVLFAQIRLAHYRVPFVEGIRARLAADNIDLDFVYGQPAKTELAKQDSGHISWAHHVVNRYIYLGNRNLVWQPLPKLARKPDLVILTQENRILSNYVHQSRRAFGGPRVGFWGHGANFQSRNRQGISERWKRLWMTNVDWWFAYTELSRELVVAAGYPSDRITVLNNSIDTSKLYGLKRALTPEGLSEIRAKLRIEDATVGLFIGSLYAPKRIGFLLETAQQIKDRIPNFNLIIVGEGPQRDLVTEKAENTDWVHYLGALYDEEKAKVMALADFILNPGLVGLAILDAFVMGLPVITTDCGLHSPEIAYLEDGINGIMTPDSSGAYVDAICSLMERKGFLSELKSGAMKSAGKYNIDQMVARFCEGVKLCLEAPRYEGRSGR